MLWTMQRRKAVRVPHTPEIDNRTFGATISIEVDVDPTFDPASHEIVWGISNVGGPTTNPAPARFQTDRRAERAEIGWE
jgi:hypothetical protein